MLLYPNHHFKNVTEINMNFLEGNRLKGIILDMDNTLIDFNRNLLDGVKQWCQDLKKNNIKLYIVSNSNKRDKLEQVSNALEIPYASFSMKPFKKGFKKAMEEMNLKNENIAVVGDQIFTDILGANRCKMFSILVDPIAEKDIILTRIKRPIERYIMKQYSKHKGAEK